MTQAPASLDLMLAAWNEDDGVRIRRHLDEALAPDVHFVDPSVDLVGVDAFEANVHEVHRQLPGAVYARTSAVDAHHGYHRYHWEIRLDGAVVLTGFDVTAIDEAGRVTEVIGFFGPFGPDDPAD